VQYVDHCYLVCSRALGSTVLICADQELLDVLYTHLCRPSYSIKFLSLSLHTADRG
jgi:hypothetical protein